MTVLAFKSSKPAEITAFLADRTAKQQAFDEKVAEFRKTVNGRELQGIRMFNGGFIVQGFAMNRRNEELPAGWRQDGSSNRAVPAKRTPEGKAIAGRIAGLRLEGASIPGAPESLSTAMNPNTGTGYEIFPRLRTVGDEHFLTLSRVPADDDLARIDAEAWTPVKMSEFHAALEAAGETI